MAAALLCAAVSLCAVAACSRQPQTGDDPPIDDNPQAEVQPDKPRFAPVNGVYTDKNAEKTGKAVLMFAGDLMISYDQAKAIKNGTYEYAASFDYVGGIFKQSDFAVTNLEMTLSTTHPPRWEAYSVETPAGNKPNCNGSPDFLEAVINAGFDTVVTANNHCLDAGLEGLTETIDHLDRYKLPHTGTFKSKDEDRFIMVDVNGIKIALLSFATGTLNTMSELYTDEALAVYVNRYLKSAVKANIAQAKEKGAEYVIVFMHWGNQNSTAVNDARAERAQYIADCGADYIVGSHPHVLNKYDVITASDGRKVPCMYSLGNFCSGMNEVENRLNRDTLILRVELEKSADGVSLVSEGYIPCHILDEHKGNEYVIMPCGEEYGGLNGGETAEARERIKQALGDKIGIDG